MRMIWMVSVVALVGACSPYVYKDPIGKFGDSFSQAMAAYDQGEKDRLAEAHASDKAAWTFARFRLGMSDDCRDPSKACKLVTNPATPNSGPLHKTETVPIAYNPAQDEVCNKVGAPQLEDPTEIEKKARNENETGFQQQVFKDFLAYIDGLQAVTNAQDKDEFNAASTKLGASVGAFVGLAGMAAGPIGTAAGPVATAVTDTALWFVGAALDHRRYVALRQATVAACRPVKVLSQAIEVLVETQQGIRLDALRTTLMFQLSSFDRIVSRRDSSDQIYGAGVDNLFSTLDTYEATRAINPVGLMNAINQAHDKLVLAIHNDDGQFDAITAALSILADNVNKIVTAVHSGKQVH